MMEWRREAEEGKQGETRQGKTRRGTMDTTNQLRALPTQVDLRELLRIPVSVKSLVESGQEGRVCVGEVEATKRRGEAGRHEAISPNSTDFPFFLGEDSSQSINH